MRKNQIFRVLRFIILSLILLYSLFEGIYATYYYLNFNEIESTMTKNNYLFTAVVFYILAVFTVVVLILNIRRELYRKKFTKKH